jgi:3-oxoacyl-[acyl-carrier protein] reductase
MNISEQLVLVTGGARGLGVAIVKALHREGAKVVINYRRSQDAAEALSAELGERTMACQADVTDPEQVARMVAAAQEKMGQPVLSVVNNALADFRFDGEAREDLSRIGWSSFARQLEGAARAALNTMQAALPAMRTHHFGRIVNIGTDLFQSPVVP